MTSQQWILVVCFSLASVLGTAESVTTIETQKYTCRTFGSGVIQPFNGSSFYVKSNCPFTLTRFIHNRVECDITTQRGNNGLLVKVEIIINKIRTVLQNGSILVEKKSVSLPYDHTYQHIFQYGIYTKLRSSLLPLSVTWHNVPGGIDSVRVELEQEHELRTDMTGLCGKHNVQVGNEQQLITENVLTEDTCQTRDPVFTVNQICRNFFSTALDCRPASRPYYIQLCDKNIYSYETNKYIGCAFFKEVVQQCGNTSYVWNTWRSVTKCAPPSCPGDLVYVEQGPAFIPSCSNPNPRFTNQDLTSSCVCPKGKVLNDYADVVHCVDVSNCPCVFAGKTYLTGDTRSTKCQSCVCNGGKWFCSENICPSRCIIEGQFVTTFDGKRYVVPGKCTYVAAQGLSWTITLQYSKKEASLEMVVLQLFQDTYTFSHKCVKVGEKEITELHQSDHALVFWQSSMYVQVHTSFGMKIQVQMSPEIQLYITPPRKYTGRISGLCGNNNNDTTDDFTTSSRIIENSPQPFALSWSVGTCRVNIPSTCSNTDNEIFADEKCSVMNNPNGIFAKCHGHIPTDQYHLACIQRTCNCGSNLQQCMCVALASYAKACANLGVAVGDWRSVTNCTLKCERNQEFIYNIRACNHTCLSLSGPDPRCELDNSPVEGCGCPEGTHLNQRNICTPKASCVCHYYGGTTPPGPVVIDGRQCLCENGKLRCSKDCGCRNGKVCVHCSEYPVSTAQKTCDSLSKPLGASITCESGCYCPHDQYEDHHGNCVSLDNCTCVYSGKVFSTGQRVKTNCKTCICGRGQWHCKEEPCPGKCQVYGNGHYQTFDSKWYRFDGHCQYTLVEDYCGNRNGSFSVRVESVPCCDEALTCSRSIILDLQGKVTLILSDMRVSRHLQKGWTLEDDLLYTTHTVGLYIIISVPNKGITLIWDKHTRITIELQPKWRSQVCGLCGNFDSSETNDIQISGSKVESSPLAFGNSWKVAVPPCSDITTEMFPCERNSYCSAWAQRRCMIITGDTFKDCHLKVDPEPYYHACVQESCSCEFEGKFLGFCTAVAAYAEACSDEDVCVNWRTPDLCPVYCDYYNEQSQHSWHYEACGKMLTCGKDNRFVHKLEGCYPRCPKDAPYYDENTGECAKMGNCTCYFNETIIQPGTLVMIQSAMCLCENGIINCTTLTPGANFTNGSASPKTQSKVPSTTSLPVTAITKGSASTETQSTVPSTTLPPVTAITNGSASTETQSTVPSTPLPPVTAITNGSASTETQSTLPSTTLPPVTAFTNGSASTETQSTVPSATSLPVTAITNGSASTETQSTVPSTNSLPVTAITKGSASTETQSTVPSTSLPPVMAITNGSASTETQSTVPSTTLPPVTAITNGSASTETQSTVPSTTLPPVTAFTKGSASTETQSTVPSTTSLPVTAITNGSASTETWSAIPSTIFTPMTVVTDVSATIESRSASLLNSIPTTSTTTSTSVTATEPDNTTVVTTNSPTTSSMTRMSTTPPMPTAASTQAITVTNTTESITEQTTVTEASDIVSTDTILSTLFTNTSTALVTESAPPEMVTLTNTSSTQPTTQHTKSTSATFNLTTSFTRTVKPNETSHPNEVTITEASTEKMTSSTITEPNNTLIMMPPTPYTTEMATSEVFTNTESTTMLTFSGGPSTTTTASVTEETYHTSAVTASLQTAFTNVSAELISESGKPGPPPNTTTNHPSTVMPVCNECKDLKMKKSWSCGETWIEDCYHKTCTNGTIELTPVICPATTVPICPRDQVTKVSDGCCETWKCDCRCELYGDPHYISFQGVTFDFLDNCTYILMEEQSPHHHLTIAVDNFYCVPDLQGSCAKGIILNYQNYTATLSIIPELFVVQATLNDMTIQPPYEEHGLRFETTGYVVSIYLPDIRSYVSLSPSYTLVINLAMEHFLNNTQGQCGVCGGGSCIRRDGLIEEDSCCDKTSYDWVYTDPLKPACVSAPRNIPCHPGPVSVPTNTPTSPALTATCPTSALCGLLDHQVFSTCSPYVNLNLKKQNCEFDSCRNPDSACSTLEQAALECKHAGFCIDWRGLTNGSCDVPCPEGLLYKECHDKLDDVCYGGVRYPGPPLKDNSTGCFCPSGQFRAGNHSNICVSDCFYCKGPLGEPKLPGEVWQSNCHMCTCNNQTRSEECFPKFEATPVCSPSAVLVSTSCCGGQTCVEKTCNYNEKTYQLGDRWKDAAHPCMSFSCSKDGIQTETKVCPRENCPEEDKIWDSQHCCFTCNQSCAFKVSNFSITIDNCKAVIQMPVCRGQCESQPSVVLNNDLLVEEKSSVCQEQSSERRSVTLQCSDLTTRHYTYKHITSCECRV